MNRFHCKRADPRVGIDLTGHGLYVYLYVCVCKITLCINLTLKSSTLYAG